MLTEEREGSHDSIFKIVRYDSSESIVTNPSKELRKAGKRERHREQQIQSMLQSKEKTIKRRMFAIVRKFPLSLMLGVVFSVMMGCAFPFMGLNFAFVSIKMLNFGFPLLNTQANYDDFVIYTWLFLLLGFLSALAQFFSTVFFTVVGLRLTRVLRQQLYSSILRKPVSWFDLPHHQPGELNAVLSGDTAQLNSVISTSVGLIFNSASSLLVGFFLSMYYSWRLGLVMLGLSPLVIVGALF